MKALVIDDNELVRSKQVDPCHSLTFSFEDIPRAHQLMLENRHPPGNMACLVNAREATSAHGATLD